MAPGMISINRLSRIGPLRRKRAFFVFFFFVYEIIVYLCTQIAR